MNSPDLIYICITAFIAVFTLLVLLAGVMRLISSVFPQASGAVSSAHIAVVATTLHALIPGLKITHIKEIE